MMGLLSNISIAIVSILHVLFMILESFLWTTPTGLKIFRMTPENAELTRVLALNQGLYNGFLAAGLFWALYTGEIKTKIFFLVCVFVAGIVGGMTAGKNIFFLQALPALISLILLWFASRN
jgi:putative membrane protein